MSDQDKEFEIVLKELGWNPEECGFKKITFGGSKYLRADIDNLKDIFNHAWHASRRQCEEEYKTKGNYPLTTSN